jgi:hypothetical protein
MQWIRDAMARRREARERRMRSWELWTNSEVYLAMPYRMFMGGEWVTWGKMQARIFSRLRENWPDTHAYVWFQTVFPPETFPDIMIPGKFEELPPGKENHYMYLFPDCPDQHVWATVLGAGTLFHLSRAIFMLDRSSGDWQKFIARFLEVALTPMMVVPATEFGDELSACQCLCFSQDQDLLLEKIDLPRPSVLSILEGVASEERLELVLKPGPAWGNYPLRE